MLFIHPVCCHTFLATSAPVRVQNLAGRPSRICGIRHGQLSKRYGRYSSMAMCNSHWSHWSLSPHLGPGAFIHMILLRGSRWFKNSSWKNLHLYTMRVKLIGIKCDLSLMQILGQAISETENHAFEHHPTPSSPTSHKYCASQMYSQRSLAMAEYHGDLFSRPNPKTLPRRNADLFKRYPPGCEPSSLGRAKPRAAVISAPDFVGFSHFSRACLIMFMDWGHSFSFNINLYSINVFTISIWIQIY